MNELLSLLQSKNLMNVIDTCVFDIDGTLCEDVKFNLLSPDERTYVKYFDDMAVIVNEIKDAGIQIEYLTGRKIEFLDMTTEQLIINGFPTATLMMYDGQDDDPDFVESVQKWKLSRIKTLLSSKKGIVVVDNDIDFIQRMKIFKKSGNILIFIGFARSLGIGIIIPRRCM
jgi:hydroxymethylpyrimidine pyrophosphatase-like HAD family hydrolase